MSDTSHSEALTRHNPFDDPKPKARPGTMIALILAVLVHGALGVYLWKTRFDPKYKEYSEEITDVALIKPVPPPPPPPPPPPNTPPPPPPKLQPRPPVAVPDMPSIPPLPVPPVERRIEEPRPPAAPPPEPPRPSVITNPDWARRPSAEEVARYYPDRAMRMEVGGSASLSCTVTARGTLSSCNITSESPADMGFGDAAIKLSKLFKMRPQTKDGQPVDGGTVRIPLRFTLPKD